MNAPPVRTVSTAHLRPGYGKGEATLETGADGEDVLAALTASFTKPTYEPPLFPGTAMDLLQLTRKVGVNMHEVTALLEKDPLIAAKVLRIASSSAYARGQPVRSMHQAVVTMGLETMATLFLQVSVGMTVFRAPGFDEPMRQLRRHSAAVAQIARAICRHTALFDEYAFLCGLLHDVGLAAAAIELTKLRPKGCAIPLADSWPIVIEVHEAAGAAVCRLWGLNEEVRTVVGHHHVPQVGGMRHPVACVVELADWIATALGAGICGVTTKRPSDDDFRAIGINERQLAVLLEHSKALVAKISG